MFKVKKNTGRYQGAGTGQVGIIQYYYGCQARVPDVTTTV